MQVLTVATDLSIAAVVSQTELNKKNTKKMPLEFDKKPNFIIFYINDFEYIDVNTTWINKIRDEKFLFPLSRCDRPKCAQ